jgi:hypothetical protein
MNSSAVQGSSSWAKAAVLHDSTSADCAINPSACTSPCGQWRLENRRLTGPGFNHSGAHRPRIPVPACPRCRVCSNEQPHPTAAFPVADATAIDVCQFSFHDNISSHWQALLGPAAAQGAVCVCSDAVALWALQLPQSQQQQQSASFIKHRLLSFPFCHRIRIGSPHLGRPLITATNDARSLEWYAFMASKLPSTAPSLHVAVPPCHNAGLLSQLTRLRWPSVRWLQHEGRDDVTSALSKCRVTCDV